MDDLNSTTASRQGGSEYSLYAGLHLPIPILVAALLTVLLGRVYLNAFFTSDPYGLTKIPTVHQSRVLDAYRTGVWWRVFIPRLTPSVREGYYKYNKNDQPFKIWISGIQGYTYVLPHKYLDRVKNVGVAEVSFAGFINKYIASGLATRELNSLVVEVASKLLNANLTAIKPLIQDQTEQSLTLEIGTPTEWKRLNALTLAKNIIKASSMRIVYGQTLSQNQTFQTALSSYLSKVLPYTFALRFVNVGPLRPLLLNLIHWQQRRSLAGFIGPLRELIAERMRIKDRRVQLFDEDENEDEHEHEKPFDCVQWAIDQDIPLEKKTHEDIAKRLITISNGTVEAVAAVLTPLLFDVAAAQREVIEELRAEMEECLALEEGGWTATSMARMRKLESFIQESLRISSAAVPLSVFRLVESETFRFDEKYVFPRGSLLTFPTRVVQTDSDLFPEPDRFDHLRFYNLKEEILHSGSGSGSMSSPSPLHIAQYFEEHTNRVNEEDIRTSWLQFGHGRQSCPGRFYALSLLKTILGELMLRYDIRFAGGRRARPALGIDDDPPLFPDGEVDLEFRGREETVVS
ncbi:cytochrome P450 [Aspergillus stella-maris]|uniref:cytochrome P450 n=1 Tax=Aspergillus stella-maris TaxID=1810926 RepID=UPI003CCD6910